MCIRDRRLGNGHVADAERNPPGHERQTAQRRGRAQHLAERVALRERAQTVNGTAEEQHARSEAVAGKQARTRERAHRASEQQCDRVRKLVLGRRVPRVVLCRGASVPGITSAHASTHGAGSASPSGRAHQRRCIVSLCRAELCARHARTAARMHTPRRTPSPPRRRQRTRQSSGTSSASCRPSATFPGAVHAVARHASRDYSATARADARRLPSRERAEPGGV